MNIEDISTLCFAKKVENRKLKYEIKGVRMK